MRFTIHHVHHLSEDDRELILESIPSMLISTAKEIAMALAPEVQSLFDQAKRSNDLLKSMDTSFRAMSIQMGALQQEVAALRANAVLTDGDKQNLKALTDDMAASFSAAQADILANTGADQAGFVAPGSQTGDNTGGDGKVTGEVGVNRSADQPDPPEPAVKFTPPADQPGGDRTNALNNNTAGDQSGLFTDQSGNQPVKQVDQSLPAPDAGGPGEAQPVVKTDETGAQKVE